MKRNKVGEGTCRSYLRPLAALAVVPIAVTLLDAGDAGVRFAWAEQSGLHHVITINDRLYCGGTPQGDDGFSSLAKLGVRTVISVDGATPDAELARKFGLRYVHLPIGYDGLSRQQTVRIARAARELPSPIYLHCHHGRHRGPAAAAIALLATDPQACTNDALHLLKLAGTDSRYAGLFDSVRGFTPLTERERAAPLLPWRESVEADGIRQAMVAIDQTWDHLGRARAAGWKQPPDRPGLDPAHEALQLVEHVRELRRLPEVAAYPDRFRHGLSEKEANAEELERLLRAPLPARDVARLEVVYQRVADQCTHCHSRYRDKR